LRPRRSHGGGVAHRAGGRFLVVGVAYQHTHLQADHLLPFRGGRRQGVVVLVDHTVVGRTGTRAVVFGVHGAHVDDIVDDIDWRRRALLKGHRVHAQLAVLDVIGAVRRIAERNGLVVGDVIRIARRPGRWI